MASTPNYLIPNFLLLLFLYHHIIPTAAAAGGGKWDLLLSNIGVSAMHLQLLNNDRVVIFDLTDFGPSNISIPNNQCRDDPNDLTFKHDCTAHSVEFDVVSNSIRPLFVHNRAILFDYAKAVVVRTYPTIPGGEPRNYPSSGSTVLLPLQVGGGYTRAEVLVCGGVPKGSYTSASNGTFVGALNSCGRMGINGANPQWVMESMPMARVMSDMVLLPNGNVLIVNGAATGTAGWELGRNPMLYRPGNTAGSRFEVQNSSSIARMYYSTAILPRDGRVLVSGSNPHAYYNFTAKLFTPL